MPAKEFRPLQGKKVVITRPYEQYEEFALLLSTQGAAPIKFPVIAIAQPDSWEATDCCIKNLKEYSWIIFTSVNGVQSFIGRLIDLKRNFKEALCGISICTVGLRTADAVERYGLRVDFVPEEFRAEAIAEGFRNMGVTKGKILLPRAEKGRDVLPEELTRMGIKVDVVPVYKVTRPEMDVSWLREMLDNKAIDVVTFTSGSCVRNFLEIIGACETRETGGSGEKGKSGDYKVLLEGVNIACISPVTANIARRYGIEVDIVPERYTVADLTEAIVKYYETMG